MVGRYLHFKNTKINLFHTHKYVNIFTNNFKTTNVRRQTNQIPGYKTKINNNVRILIQAMIWHKPSGFAYVEFYGTRIETRFCRIQSGIGTVA